MRIPPRAALAAKFTLVALVLAAALAQAADFKGSSTRSRDTSRLSPRFIVRGNVEGLAPGMTRWMRLRVRNPNKALIRVRTITVTVRSATAGCPRSAVRVSRFAGSRRIPARRTAIVRVRARMVASAPDLCQGARFRLIYGGRAIRG